MINNEQNQIKELLQESYETIYDGMQKWIPIVRKNIGSWQSSSCKSILKEKPSKHTLEHLLKCLKKEKIEGWKEIYEFVNKIKSGKYKSDMPIFEQQISKFFNKFSKAIS